MSSTDLRESCLCDPRPALESWTRRVGPWMRLNCCKSQTSAQSNLAKVRIAVLSLLVAASAFVRRVRWAGTFARGGKRTLRNAFVRGYVIVGRQVPLLQAIWFPI